MRAVRKQVKLRCITCARGGSRLASTVRFTTIQICSII